MMTRSRAAGECTTPGDCTWTCRFAGPCLTVCPLRHQPAAQRCLTLFGLSSSLAPRLGFRVTPGSLPWLLRIVSAGCMYTYAADDCEL